MPYITSMLKVQDSQTALSSIITSWKDKEDRKKAEEIIKKFFPKTEIPTYDAYFLFPKRSHVCIRCTTHDELLVDCYSHIIKACSTDFLHILQRLQDIFSWTIRNFGIESEHPTLVESLYTAAVPGGVLLFVIPLVIENVVPVSYRIHWYVIVATLYAIGVGIYSWWNGLEP